MNDKNSDYENLDGLRVVIDSKLKVASIILDRPPYNVVSMLQREHLSSVFKKLDNDKNVRIGISQHHCPLTTFSIAQNRRLPHTCTCLPTRKITAATPILAP